MFISKTQSGDHFDWNKEKIKGGHLKGDVENTILFIYLNSSY